MPDKADKDSQDSLVGKKVVVSLTGRIDSAVAAFLLKKQKMNVIGISLALIDPDEYGLKDNISLCYLNNLDSIKEFCDSINIPFYAVDSKNQFNDRVIDKFVTNKLTGYANNSCFDCNRMRMNVLYEKMLKLDAEYMATGHYAKIFKNIKTDEHLIHSSNDLENDQSHLISGIDKEVIKHLILPLGELKKSEVHKIYKNFNLRATESVTKKHFCFQKASINTPILQKSIPKDLINKGPVLNIVTDDYFGEHVGVSNYFIGQDNLEFQGAVTQIDKSFQILRYQIDNKSIVVGPPEDLAYDGAHVARLLLSDNIDKKKPMTVFVKSKYLKDYLKANLFFKNNSTLLLTFEKEISPLIIDDIIIIYEKKGANSKVLGKGQISDRGGFERIDRVDEFRHKSEKEENEEELDENEQKRIKKVEKPSF